MRKKNMKKIFYLLIVTALALLSSCQEPEFVEPTIDRQNITSLTAYFTQGKFVEKEMGKLEIAEDEDIDRYVIPIMYYYPEESDDVTTLEMSRVRVRAELAPNCKIDPPLTILDLNQENPFTFTNSKGESKNIIITGQRVKFKTAQFLSFNLINPETGALVVEGFVDNEEKTIYLFTIDDLTGLVVEGEPWYHGSIKDYEELSTIPSDWNEERTVVAIAHDGKTEQEFSVKKRNPSKIRYGFNAATARELFNVDPRVTFDAPDYMLPVYSSIAYVDGYLAVCHGPDYTPVYLDARNGSKVGEIATGGRSYSAITNDEGGNMLLCNHLETAGTFEIYRTASVTEDPVLWHSYNSTVSLPMGAKIRVTGNIDTDAAIVVNYEGVDNVTSSGQFLQILVKNGAVVSETVHDVYTAAGVSWGSSPINAAGLVPTNAAGDNGWFYASYSINGMQWIRPDYQLGKVMGTAEPDDKKHYLLNENALDSKQFNNANYLVLFVAHHFPAWERQPSFWLYDIGDPATVSGQYEKSSSIVAYNSWVTYFNASNNAGNETVSSSDVVIAQSKDGLRIYVFYYDHYAGAIGGYTADCVKRE